MLEKDRKVRLGQKNDLDDILGHPWFADLDIKQLLEKKIKPPYIPTVQSETELKKDSEQVKTNVTESIVPQEKKELIANKDEVF